MSFLACARARAHARTGAETLKFDTYCTYIDMDHEIIYISTSTQVCVAKAGRNGQNDRPNLLARICARARAHARAGGFFSN